MNRRSKVVPIYRRFEETVAFVLTVVIGAVIVVALWRLVVGVTDTLPYWLMRERDDRAERALDEAG